MSESGSRKPRIEMVDPQTARRWIDLGEAVLVDVREPHEFAMERIQGATLVPLSAFDPRSIPASDGKRLLLMCASGIRCGMASALLARAEAHEKRKLPLTDDAREALIAMADGDGRAVITLAEDVWLAASSGARTPLDREALVALVQRRAPIYDKSQDGHYNLISALHKSVRGSDPDASLYWLARMLAGGEDPLYIARRLVRMAIEDIGLADPNALVQTNAAKEVYDLLGSPEGELALAQATLYLALAPKSNASYVAFGAASRAAEEGGSLSPPKHILNAPTRLMKQEGYGRGYAYDHNEEEAFSGQNYFPDGMRRQNFYEPTSYGFERELKERLERFAKLRAERVKRG